MVLQKTRIHHRNRRFTENNGRTTWYQILIDKCGFNPRYQQCWSTSLNSLSCLQYCANWNIFWVQPHSWSHIGILDINCFRFRGKEQDKKSNCRGQLYDNTSNIAGPYSGLQARFKEVFLYADYVTCAGHSLNRVVSKQPNTFPSQSVSSPSSTFMNFSLLQLIGGQF